MKLYVDHNACTPVDARILERFLAVERACPANPGSQHASGQRARATLEQSRGEVATALDVPPASVIFVASGTEANNLVVRGSGDPDLPVLLAAVEHASVVEPAEARGAVWWPVSAEGMACIQPPPQPVGLICLVHGQSEVGSLQPIEAAADLARTLRVPLHVDASQTLGRVPLAVAVRVADSITLSTHKAGGLRGASVLIVRNPDQIRPLLLGGGQENGRRPGTQSPALAAATALAVQLATREQDQRAGAMARATAAFDAAIRDRIPARRVTPNASLPNTVMYHFEGLDGRTLMPALDLAGVEASWGAACSSGAPRPPRVLTAMGFDSVAARACVRFSFTWHTDPDLATRAGEIVAQVVAQLRQPTIAR